MADRDHHLDDLSSLARNLNDEELWEQTRKAVESLGMDHEALEESRRELLHSLRELRGAPEAEVSFDEDELRGVIERLSGPETPEQESALSKCLTLLNLETGSGGRFYTGGSAA